MNLAFDIDDTVTASPELFAALSGAAGVKKVIIVSSRGSSEESCRLTASPWRKWRPTASGVMDYISCTTAPKPGTAARTRIWTGISVISGRRSRFA